MDRWRRTVRQQRTLPGDEVPVVLARDGTHGPVIHAVSAEAARRGIGPGERIVDVQAIHPDLHVEGADPAGDVKLLDRVAQWARRWCPWTVRDGEEGIVMEITGAAHLFGGEAAMLRDISARFRMQGLTTRLAVAPTRGAAQMLARFGAGGTLCGPEDIEVAIAPLPVAALRIDPDTERLLQRLGLKTLGKLMEVPRVALMRRFDWLAADVNPLVLLDRALGKLGDPLNAPADGIRTLARVRLAEPVIDPVPHLDALAEDLCRQMSKTEQGARLLRLTIYRVDGEWRSRDVALAQASRDPAHLLRLLTGKLEGIDPGFGFDLLTLEALRVEPLALHQDHLDGRRDASADVAALLDRLTAKLGREKISWSAWVESHLPERVEERVAALSDAPAAAPAVMRTRPLRLLEPPEEVAVLYAVPEGPPARFRWRRVSFLTARHEGPERIAPEWWRDRPGTRLRDYYRVEVTDGRRFWLFREGILGDGRGGDPRWFLHGIFA
ncbi:MAG: DNA polymerase Y family protein [Sulfitobacter sp.]|nr:DNA polymerase Y family protein [Sulfitobacter sp.]